SWELAWCNEFGPSRNQPALYRSVVTGLQPPGRASSEFPHGRDHRLCLNEGHTSPTESEHQSTLGYEWHLWFYAAFSNSSRHKSCIALAVHGTAPCLYLWQHQPGEQ